MKEHGNDPGLRCEGRETSRRPVLRTYRCAPYAGGVTITSGPPPYRVLRSDVPARAVQDAPDLLALRSFLAAGSVVLSPRCAPARLRRVLSGLGELRRGRGRRVAGVRGAVAGEVDRAHVDGPLELIGHVVRLVARREASGPDVDRELGDRL